MKNIKILESLDEIKSIDEQKKSIDSYRPFSKELENKIFQKLKLDWNYNSNAIEGNQLSYGETVAFLNFGLTAKGKPFKDHLDIKGHNEAIGFMLQLIKENRPLSESDIKDLHKIILVEPYFSKTMSPQGIEFEKEIKIGQYKNSPNHVKTVSGDIHYYTNPEEVPFEMNNLLEWYRKAEEENLHPVVMSAVFHHKFTSIHPFDDGNGRLARILSNFILLKHNYPVIVIKNRDKVQYYAALNIADNGIYEDLIKLFAENVRHSFVIIHKAINGENINEADDLDKEIELFVKEMQFQNIKTVDFEKDKGFLIDTYIKGFLEYLLPKIINMGELFNRINLQFYYNNHGNYDNMDIFNVLDYLQMIPKIEKRFETFNKFEKDVRFKLSLINYFWDDKLSLEIPISLSFKRKSVTINVLNEDNTLLYRENPDSVFIEITRRIMNSIMSKINNK